MIEVESGTRLRRARRTAARTIKGASVDVVIDTQTMHTLNEVGTYLFEHMDGASVEELVARVVDEFDVDPETAQSDIRDFVAEMLALGALEVVS